MRGQLFEVWEGFAEKDTTETGNGVAQGEAMACVPAQKHERGLREMEGNMGWLKCRVKDGRWGRNRLRRAAGGRQILQGLEGLLSHWGERGDFGELTQPELRFRKITPVP